MVTGDPTSNKPPEIEAALAGKYGPPEAVLDHFGENADLIVGLGNSEPVTVLDAIETRAEELSGVTVHQMLPLRERCYMHGDFEGLRGGSRRGDGNECDRPAFVVSFVLDAEGRVLDGTPLHAAIERIDAKAPPLFYSISCVHPSVAARALRDERVFSDLVVRRLVEFIVQLDHLEGHDAEHFAAGMWEIHEDFGLRILGGCCGTDDRHMRTLAALMADANKT